MRITLNWLKDFLQTDASIEQLDTAFTRLGHEVEAVEYTGHNYDKVVVGYVAETKQHPNADRLNICTVDIGADELKQIVCGAPNVRKGLNVAVALEGAILPGDFEIKKSKIRGESSDGMICSTKELGLGTDSEGIWEMDTIVTVGTPLNEVLPKNDIVFDLSITPNRGDALSVLGLARDLAAGGIGTFSDEWISQYHDTDKKQHGEAEFMPEIKTDGCSFFCGISVRGIDNNIQTPDWIKTRLEAAGLRPINTAVDISQYVMLALGQPLHFYDSDNIDELIAVTTAKGGEKVNGLDDQTHTLNKDDLIIIDSKNVLGIAGIVGGVESSVTTKTKNVFIEAAQFDRGCIARTGQALQINSDARHRFERGIDPSKTLMAALISAYLLESICGGEVSHVAKAGQQMPVSATIDFNPELIRTFGGLDMSAKECTDILYILGYDITKDGDTFKVVVPPHLTMTETPEDLVEDILRIKGYDAVPVVLPSLNLNTISTAAPTRKIENFARRHMASCGYFEASSYSFISQKAAKLFGGGDESLKLTNPIDAEGMSDMRPSLLPSLLQAAERNRSRGEQSIHLAEVGTTFHSEADKVQKLDHTETLKVAAIRIGDSHSRNPHAAATKPNVFEIKANAFSILEALGHDLTRIMIKAEAPAWYHPERSGALIVQGRCVGHFGQLHPQTVKKMGLKDIACAMELDLSMLNIMKVKPQPFAMSTFQPVRRDFAFVVDKNLPAADLITTVRKAEKNLLQEVNIFDAYEGDKLPTGKKSLAISITLQADDKTLTEADITKVSDAIIAAAKKQHQAEIRS